MGRIFYLKFAILVDMNKSFSKKRSQSIGKKITSIFIGEKKEIKLLGIIIGAGLLIIASLFFSSSKSAFKKEKNSTQLASQANCEYRSIINGVCVERAEDRAPTVVAVMIENHPAARPQSGLVEAEVVYEAMVEGNYTRFLAVYPYHSAVAKVGPVRSARPYYLDWLAEYDDPLYMHVGGSPEALNIIKQRDIWDANEMFMGSSFWRAGNRQAPHNTYTNAERWQKIIGTETNGPFESWDFATSTITCTESCVDFVEIPYLRPDFVTGWKYNSSTEQYVRWQGDGPHQTETGLIYADTILIMEVPYTVLDEIGRLEMKTIGSGPAVVVLNGQKITGHWSKSSVAGRTQFYNDNNHEILFKPGKIWIQVVPKLSVVSFK